MPKTLESNLEFIASHVRWCLDQPLVYGNRDWGGAVCRALEQLADTFEQHVAVAEAPGGSFARIVDPNELPFSHEARQVAGLRQQHGILRNRLDGVAGQFRSTLRIFPPQSNGAGPRPEEDDLQEARALRLWGALEPCVRDLLEEVETHLTAEAALVAGSSGHSVIAQQGVDAGQGPETATSAIDDDAAGM